MKYLIYLSAILAAAVQADDDRKFKLEDVFSLEYASDLEISNDGSKVYFARNFMDIQSDKKLSNIWVVNSKNGRMRPITSGHQKDYGPKLSPDGRTLAYISTQSGSAQIHMKWLASGSSAKLSNLSSSPSDLHWSPDGKYIAFKMFVKGKPNNPVSLPGKPNNAEWADPAILIESVYYRFDGAGYTEPGYQHLFVMSSDGGSARQLSTGNFDHNGGISWSKDGKALYFSANRKDNNEKHPLNSEIYRIDIDSREIVALTERYGPDAQPKVSPDGRWLAYTGFDDQLSNYENTQIYIMDRNGKNRRSLTQGLDRSVSGIHWDGNSKGIYFKYDDHGKTVLAYQPLQGKKKVVTDQLGGLSYGRPYTASDFDVARNGVIAFTYSNPKRPADLAVSIKGRTRVLTKLNEDLFSHKQLGQVEELWFKSAYDQKDIQAWIVYPPGFDKTKQYPLLLEIHGGPVAAYGPHFSAEVQLYAAAGYVVLYVNPRGSSSYGKPFAQMIHHNYPNQDYVDLMSGVDALIKKGFIDKELLFVTGGSGGGVLTSWIVGHTDRFKAAVVAKPVINWYSFVLTADGYPFFYKYWFSKKPWEDMEQYMRRSPISYVGNVKTPTMLLTGESDYRTPISETEQFYQALKIQEVETAMVRIPGASHGIANRPSHLMAKVAYILWWFEKYRDFGKQDKKVN